MAPVEDTALVIDLLSQAVNDCRRRPNEFVLFVDGLRFCGLLLREHGVENWHDPVFEGAVVIVGYNEVSNSVEAFGAQLGACSAEGAHVGVAEAFDEVFFDAAGGGHDGGDVVVLCQVPQRAP